MHVFYNVLVCFNASYTSNAQSGQMFYKILLVIICFEMLQEASSVLAH